MTALASVDLPEPFGPMSAWISPAPTVRSTPLRISFSPARTWRFWISSMYSSSDGHLVAGELHEVGQGRVVQRADDPALDAGPEQLRRAAPGVVGVGADDALGVRVGEALHGRDRALEGLDDIIHGDLLGGAGEPVAAVGAAGALHQVGPLEPGHDLLQVGQGQALGLGDGLEADRLLGLLAPELDHEPHAILRLGGEDHGPKSYQRGRCSHRGWTMADWSITHLDDVEDFLGDYPGEMKMITYPAGA